MNRTEFLARIRQARQHLPEVPAPAPEELKIARRVSSTLNRAELTAMYAERVKALGMFPHLTSANGWLDTIVQILNERGVKDVRVTRQPPLDDEAVLERLSGQERKATRWQSGPEAFEADAGVSVALGGVAETGSILIRSDALTPRQATLVPPNVIILVFAGTIVPDLADALASVPTRLAENASANLTLVTGPSKTSDIEKTLVTGVHGPGIMDVVIVQE